MTAKPPKNRKKPPKKSTSAPSAHKIRIIAGKHRGRRIPVADREGLRPSPDRVRETVFNWLQFEIAGAHVLDAFAGSGAMGLEMLSRGAASVLFLDQDARNVGDIRTLLLEWKEPHGRALQTDALKFAPSGSRYDLIFLDPPFAAKLHQAALDYFAGHAFLKPHGKIYLETPFPPENLTLPAGFSWRKMSKAGRIYFGLLQRDDDAAHAEKGQTA